MGVVSHSEGALDPTERDTVPPQDIVVAALEKAPVGAVLASMEGDGRILYVNAEFTATTGYQLADIPTVTEWLAKAYPDPDYHRMVAANWTADTDPENMGREVVYRVRCADGTDRELQFRASMLSERHMFVAALDVTDRERGRRALEDSEEKYSHLFHAFPYPVFVHDMAGRILDANAAAAARFGYSMEEMLALRIPALHPPGAMDASRQAFQDVRTTGAAQFVTDFRCKDRSAFPAKVSASVFKASGRELVQAVIVDLSEQRAVEQERRQLDARLQHSQKMEAIGELAGGVAHDFNNMLTVILGNAELLRMDFGEGSESGTLVDQIVSASRRAADLTGQLLTFARRGELKPECVDMHRVIREVETLLLHGIDRQINVELDLAASRATVSGDPASLETSLLNLGLNARDAIEGPGRITIRTENRHVSAEGARKCLGDLVEGDYLQVVVADDGRGMDPEVVSRAFEPFFTTKAQGKGTGLGLATVYGCVAGLGGGISVESEKGVGSTFRLFLPTAVGTAPAETQHVGEQPAATPGRGGHILLVDDEELVRDFTATAIRSLGYTVATAVDGADAVRMFRTHRDEIDLVVLDLVMPNMSGQEAFREFKRIDPNVRVLVASGYARDTAADELLAEGVVGFLGKPFLIDDLAHKLATHMPAG